MISTRMFAQGTDELARALELAATTVQPKIDAVTRMHGQILVTRIQAKASGRPGPNAPTGDYRRSWNVQYLFEGGAVVADVGTDRPQGRRLEFGFHGADSLGRVYDQPPYPHVQPAVAEVFPMYEKAVAAVVVV